MTRRRKPPRDKDPTRLYREGGFDAQNQEHVEESGERFSARSKNAQQNKMLKTTVMRAEGLGEDLADLPAGQVVQVFSRFLEVESAAGRFLCTARKTMSRTSDTQIVVGDRVRFRPNGLVHESGQPEGVIEQVQPRETILTRTNSFNQRNNHPIVANARQMLIVASLWAPFARWGLIDRMLIAAQSGGLRPIICLNKMDLASRDEGAAAELPGALAAMDHYESMGVACLKTSVEDGVGLAELAAVLADEITVLAGHSGVGKSSLVNAVSPGMALRVGEVSEVHLKGRHTTTSARRYDLPAGGAVIDTPGVKLFGLWGVTRENLDDFFPDITAGTAPQWRIESHQRIAASLGPDF